MDQILILERAQRLLRGDSISVTPTLSVEPNAGRPFQVGDSVAYRIPAFIESPTKYQWVWYQGVVQAVDCRLGQLVVIPTDEAQPWRAVSWVYVEKAEKHEE
jgi:hypothetical protein